jgi:ribosomal protein L37AE/L43A
MHVSSRTHHSDPEPEDAECAGCGETISTGLYRRSMGVYACESCHHSAVGAYMESLE